MAAGWRYDGMLCEADDLNYGAMWECPLLIELNTIPTHPGRQSQDAVDELSNSFHNLSAFWENSKNDSAKSRSVIAANDPRDSALQVKFNLSCSRDSSKQGFEGLITKTNFAPHDV